MSDKTYNDNGVECPKCNHLHTEPYEYFSDNQEVTSIICGSCEALLIIAQIVSTTYTARAVEKEDA